MKDEQDYIRDIAEIRSMMERSSKFLSLSGWAGIMAGIYALAGAYIAYKVFDFNPDTIAPGNLSPGNSFPELFNTILLALAVFTLAIFTAIFVSYREANKRNEKLWNATSRRLLMYMGVPLVVGGLLILILISKGMLGLIAPLSLLFYGLALYNAGKFTYEEVRIVGLIQIILGLTASYYVEYGLLLWAAGFGLVHILYGIYMHYRYEK